METEIAPMAARYLMPADYLKRIQEISLERVGRAYSTSTISFVVTNSRTKHRLWPLVVELAIVEKKRIDREQELNAEWLKSLEA